MRLFKANTCKRRERGPGVPGERHRASGMSSNSDSLEFFKFFFIKYLFQFGHSNSLILHTSATANYMRPNVKLYRVSQKSLCKGLGLLLGL